MIVVDGSALLAVFFDDVQVRAAAAAFNRYGKGIDPKASLNMSDCAAYALAKSMGAPLLFKGNDSIEIDITSMLPSTG